MEHVFLVDETERLTFEIGETKIFYRRLSPERARIMRELHTTNGEVNTDALGKDGLEFCVSGWEGVYNPDGEKVEYSTTLLDKLPGQIRQELINRIIDGTETQELEKKIKN